MARTKQTTKRSRSRRTISVPADEVVPDGEQRDLDESRSDEEAPSTSGSSGVGEVGGEGAASSNEASDAEAGEGSRAESSGSDQDNFADDYQQPPKVVDNPNPKRTRMLPADALKMVDPAKTPTKSAALLRKEAALAKKAAVDAKESKKGGDSAKRIPRSFSKLLKRQGEDLEKAPAAKAARKDPSPQTHSAAKSDRPTTGGKSPAAMKILSESLERSQQKALDSSTTSKGGEPPNVAAGATTTGEEQKPAPHPDTQEEALKMLQLEKTPKRSSATIRKDLAEKVAAELRAKGGEVGKSFEKQLKRAREENPAVLNKIKKSTSASTPGASAGPKTMRISGRLKKTKVERLEKDAAQAQKNFAATLEAEQNRLVAESDADNNACMKIVWAVLYPDADYSIWALAHSYAEYVVYLREEGESEPASFEAWVSSNNETSAPDLPGPGEAQEIPSDGEEEGEDQEAPSAGQK
ncbi:uncharacterized protein LOC110719928 [Chenopodium quinoa]|uniref:uncharacterized protein LOC110719928 n=1 Tax=Chenopodium quinoa TaxID=63459 RepID=UPI000B780A03|nr:uncharacterized protein LOC110719928 [Chenopodium quinoa]